MNEGKVGDVTLFGPQIGNLAVLAAEEVIMEVPIGSSETLSTVVDETNVASAVKSGLLPVFSTPAMIALMENAATVLLERFVDAGQTSVGARIEVDHLAPSRIGEHIRATATVVSVDRKLVTFDVEARDGLRLIGRGRHVRAVIDQDKFMARLMGNPS